MKRSVKMEQFGQRLVVLSLCLLAAVIISEQKLPNDLSRDDEICPMYMQGTSSRLNISEAFNMITLEFGWDPQTGNVTQMTKLFQRSDRNYDGYLNPRECMVFIRHVFRTIG